MAAHADDLRYFYSAHLGPNETVAASDVAASVAAALTPGRYLIHYTDLSLAGEKIWIKQGPFGVVTATVAAPSFPLSDDGIRAIEITVRPAAKRLTGQPSSADDAISVIMPAGITCNLHITNISRGRS